MRAVAEGVGGRHPVDLRRERAEALLVGHIFRGHAHREVRAAVVAVLDDDDCGALGVGTGDLHRVLDCLGAGVEQRRALLVIAGCDAIEGLAYLDVTGVRGDHEAGVGEVGNLTRHPLDDIGVRVADRGNGDAGAEVDHRVAIDVDEHAAAGLDDEHRPAHADAGRHCLGLAREQCLRLRARDARDEPALLRKFGFGALGSQRHDGPLDGRAWICV